MTWPARPVRIDAVASRLAHRQLRFRAAAAVGGRQVRTSRWPSPIAANSVSAFGIVDSGQAELCHMFGESAEARTRFRAHVRVSASPDARSVTRLEGSLVPAASTTAGP